MGSFGSGWLALLRGGFLKVGYVWRLILLFWLLRLGLMVWDFGEIGFDDFRYFWSFKLGSFWCLGLV